MTTSKPQQILDALGGVSNVTSVEPCITRLRVEVTDAKAVDEPALKEAGALGVVWTGRIIQVILGPGADDMAAAIDALL